MKKKDRKNDCYYRFGFGQIGAEGIIILSMHVIVCTIGT